MRRVCRVLGLAPSTYYAADQKESLKAIEDEKLSTHIIQVFHEHHGRYGALRIHAEIFPEQVRHDRQGGLSAVRRLMGREELIAIQPRGARPHTSDGKAASITPNLLLINGYPLALNQAWAGDITYIPIIGGWIYLAIVIDLYSRKIIGWQLLPHLRAELACDALQDAVNKRDTPPGLYFHSDRGSQYDSGLYQTLLTENGLNQSISAKGNPYHNARVESTFSRIKAELLQGQRFRDLQHACARITDFIERYYNRKRLHSSLNYLAPATFEARVLSIQTNPK